MNSKSLLEDFLPTEPSVTELIPRLNVRDLSRLACTCGGINKLFKDHLLREQSAHYVIVKPDNDNIKKVIGMMNTDSMLLEAKVRSVKDQAGRIIKNKTLFQLAYGAGDVDLCLAMKTVFIKHYGSEEAAIKEMERQRNEILESEEEYKKKEIENAAHLQLILLPVIAAINAEQFNLGSDANNKLILSPATLTAIVIFRIELKKWMMNIGKGMHFRYKTLPEVYDTYEMIAGQWELNDEYNKCMLFADGVLSSILAYVPVNDAQMFSQGLYYIQDKKEPCRRSLALGEGGENYYETLRGPSTVFALSGCCIDIRGTRNGTGYPMAPQLYVSKHTSNKNIKLAELMRPAATEVSAYNLKK